MESTHAPLHIDGLEPLQHLSSCLCCRLLKITFELPAEKKSGLQSLQTTVRFKKGNRLYCRNWPSCEVLCQFSGFRRGGGEKSNVWLSFLRRLNFILNICVSGMTWKKSEKTPESWGGKGNLWRRSEAAEELKLRDRDGGSYVEWEDTAKGTSGEIKT